jgi:hypothetical protein
MLWVTGFIAYKGRAHPNLSPDTAQGFDLALTFRQQFSSCL